MKTVTEHIREHLLRPMEGMPALEVLAETEWSPAFEKRMRDAMIQGAFRYGRVTPGFRRYDRVGQMMRRLMDYESTGDKALLADIANFAMLEWMEQ